MRRRILCSFVVFLAVGVAALAAQVEGAAERGAADRGRHRRRSRDRGHPGDAGSRRHASPRRERRRCGRGRGRRPRSDRAVLVRRRRRRVHGHSPRRPAPPWRQGDHDRRPRDGAGGDASGLLLGERRAAPLQRRALQRTLRRRAGNGRDLGQGAQALRDDLPREGARAGDPSRPQRLRHRPDLLRPDAGQRGLVQRHPRVRGALPRSRRHAARRRHRLPQPRPREHVRAYRVARRGRLLRGQGRRRPGRHRPEPGRRADRQPRLAPRRHDLARPRQVQGARAQADARRLPRPRRLRDGPALERRLDRRRGAQHPGGLPRFRG